MRRLLVTRVEVDSNDDARTAEITISETSSPVRRQALFSDLPGDMQAALRAWAGLPAPEPRCCHPAFHELGAHAPVHTDDRTPS